MHAVSSREDQVAAIVTPQDHMVDGAGYVESGSSWGQCHLLVMSTSIVSASARYRELQYCRHIPES